MFKFTFENIEVRRKKSGHKYLYIRKKMLLENFIINVK